MDCVPLIVAVIVLESVDVPLGLAPGEMVDVGVTVLEEVPDEVIVAETERV